MHLLTVCGYICLTLFFFFGFIDDTILYELQFEGEWAENSKQSSVPYEIRWLPRSID